MVKTNGIFGVKCPTSLCLGGSIILPSYKKDGIGARRSIIPQLIKWIILLDMYQARKMSGHGFASTPSCLPLMVSNTYCVVFLLCFSSSCGPYMLPVSLDCPFLIPHSVFTNFYLIFIIKRVQSSFSKVGVD
jgi:hypothetical protein